MVTVRSAPSSQKGTEKQEGAKKSRGHRVVRGMTSGQEFDELPRECVQDDTEWLGSSDYPGITE